MKSPESPESLDLPEPPDAPDSRGPIYTIGHSTRSADAFVALLAAHGIGQLADVRTIPQSRRMPHFGRGALEAFLAQHGIAYRHFPALGGLRKPRADSVNTAWKNEGFRGYADYMQTEAFDLGLNELLAFAHSPTAVMCAEALWWRCHRQLLSDALLVRGVPVLHIVSPAPPKLHELGAFGRAEDGKVIYRGLL